MFGHSVRLLSVGKYKTVPEAPYCVAPFGKCHHHHNSCKHLSYHVHKGAFSSHPSCFFPYRRWHDADTVLLFYAAESKLHLK